MRRWLDPTTRLSNPGETRSKMHGYEWGDDLEDEPNRYDSPTYAAPRRGRGTPTLSRFGSGSHVHVGRR